MLRACSGVLRVAQIANNSVIPDTPMENDPGLEKPGEDVEGNGQGPAPVQTDQEGPRDTLSTAPDPQTCSSISTEFVRTNAGS